MSMIQSGLIIIYDRNHDGTLVPSAPPAAGGIPETPSASGVECVREASYGGGVMDPGYANRATIPAIPSGAVPAFVPL